MRRKNTKIQEINSFSTPQPVTGGNMYENYVKRKTTEETTQSTMNLQPLDTINSEVSLLTKNYIDSTTPHWWILMQEQANYFCNQFMWECKDLDLKVLLINVIRCAFYNGCAGLYYNDITGDFEAVCISDIEYNANGKIVKAKYSFADQFYNGQLEKEEYNFQGLYDIPESKINNLALFKWGTEGRHAWIRILPYVKSQEFLLRQLAVQRFSYIKKYVYKCSSVEAAKKEMALYFNPENPFIVNTGLNFDDEDGLSMENRFTEMNLKGSSGALESLEYYEKFMSIIYSQIGRRQNVDDKKERNITSEVEASQENFDILFLDVNRQFNIFVNRANEIIKKTGRKEIELITKDYYEKPVLTDENNKNEENITEEKNNEI